MTQIFLETRVHTNLTSLDRYWWRRGKEMLVGAGGELRLGRATRDMTANYTVSAYSRRGAINNTFLLNVQCMSLFITQ